MTEVDESELEASNLSATSNSLEKGKRLRPTSYELSRSIASSKRAQPASSNPQSGYEHATGCQPRARQRGPLLEESAKIQEERKFTHEAKSEKKKQEGYQKIINFGDEGRCGILATHFHHKSF